LTSTKSKRPSVDVTINLREFNSLSATTIPARANSASASSCMRPLESAIVSLLNLLGTDPHLLLLLALLAGLAEGRNQIAVYTDGLRRRILAQFGAGAPFGNRLDQP